MIKDRILIKEKMKIGVVTENMDWILDTIYNGQHPNTADPMSLGPKVKMIKALRMMSKMINPDDTWGLRACKDYIETNWKF